MTPNPDKQRRLAEIEKATGGRYVDPSQFVVVGTCDYCGWHLEAGWCYTCRPVEGYGKYRLPKPGSKARARFKE